MGITYFTTFIFEYLLKNKIRHKLINLLNENVIIDGYSLFYYICYKLNQEDQDKLKKNIIPDGLSEDFRRMAKQFKENCANVRVIFDGCFERNEYRRANPTRDSTIQFKNNRTRLPPFLHDLLMNILHELNIDVQIAPGEADPMIVRKANEHNAYIIARDSDYFLYETNKGYISLELLDMDKLEGPCYHMQDVFTNMIQPGVALWATTITYKFISFDDLQKNFNVQDGYDSNEFNEWLMHSESDHEKSLRIRCQYNMLRLIQKMTHKEVFNRIIRLVKEEEQEAFRNLMQGYIDVSLSKQPLTFNGNEIHPYLNTMYVNGRLDSDIINILVRRKIINIGEGNDQIYLRMLLPMCRILMEWDHSTSNEGNRLSFVTFNGEKYNPSACVDCDHLPTLEKMSLSDRDKKHFVLGCVRFVLGNKFDWNDIHKDYKLLLCLLKLWLHTKTECSNSSKATVLAIIGSFTKHALLDTYGEIADKFSNRHTLERIPEKPYRKYSYKELKSSFTHEQCRELRNGMKRYAETYSVNSKLKRNEIEKHIQEFQKPYKALSMVNQFAGRVYDIPSPEFCFNQFTCDLAVQLGHSKNISKEVDKFCSGNEILSGLIKELYDFLM